MKKKPIVAVVYNCLTALATATSGAVVLGWPLLAVFVKIQKTNLIVKTTLATVMKNYTQLSDYLLSPFNDRLQMSNFPTFPNAARHSYECKLLLELVIVVLVVGLIILIFLKMRKRMNYIYISRITALTFMILPVIILPFVLMNFDEFFVASRRLLFNNGDWPLNPVTDPIINILTEGFFVGCFATGGIVYELYPSCFILSKKQRSFNEAPFLILISSSTI